MKLTDIRRENLRALIATHGTGKLAQMLGYKHPTFISQMGGPNPTREMTEKSARGYEEKLGLDSGYFDTDHTGTSPAAVPASGDQIALVADVIRLIGSICAEEEITLPPIKFADVVALAYLDTVEHGNVARPEHAKQLVRLLK